MSEPTIKVSLTARQVDTIHAALGALIAASHRGQTGREDYLVNIKTILEVMPRRNHSTHTAYVSMWIDDD